MQVKIYLIMNRTNFKKYVGQTSRTIARRFGEHSGNLKYAIGQAIKKYGRDNFLIVVLETCETLEKANEREKIAKKLTGRKDPAKVKARKRSAQKKRYAENPGLRKTQGDTSMKRFSDPDERKKHSEIMKQYKAENPVSETTRQKIAAKKTKYRKKVRCIEAGEIFESVSDAAKCFNANATRISRVCRGIRKTYHSYHFEFVD